MSSRTILLLTIFYIAGLLFPTCQAAQPIPRAATSVVTTTVTSTSTVTKFSTVSVCPTTTSKPASSLTSSTLKTTTTTTTVRPVTTTTTSTSPTSSDGVKQVGCLWQVPNVGGFTTKATYAFTGSNLPDGWLASEYTVQDRDGPDSVIPYNHAFKKTNVAISDGYLNLKVPGAQKPSASTPISCAEVQSTFKILYGSIRFTAQFSSVPGTCQSGFLYKNDSQEIDIEYLSDSTSQSNNGAGKPIPFWYSNQAIEPGTEATQSSIVSPQNPTTGLHEYRLDWTPAFSAFFIDGVEQTRYFDNIPTSPLYWIFNNWSNGDKGWSVGPPSGDNVLKIKGVTMYYNSTDSSGSCSK